MAIATTPKAAMTARKTAATEANRTTSQPRWPITTSVTPSGVATLAQ